MNKQTLFNKAEHLADVILSLTQKNDKRFASKTPVGLIKLPPVFTKDDIKYGEPKKNLTAMIKVLAEYEEGSETGNYPTLNELPSRFNHHIGNSQLEDKDMRKIHNWLQQISFAVRAAMIYDEIKNSNDVKIVAKKIYDDLYRDNTKRAFVTYSFDNKYELKPLRYASETAKLNWIEQEVKQIKNWNNNSNELFGARPTPVEWEHYGLKGQSKSVTSAIRTQIDTLIKQAAIYDHLGQHEEADAIDNRINTLYQNITMLNIMDEQE